MNKQKMNPSKIIQSIISYLIEAVLCGIITILLALILFFSTDLLWGAALLWAYVCSLITCLVIHLSVQREKPKTNATEITNEEKGKKSIILHSDDSDDKPRICICCGAPLPEKSYKCNYCGVSYNS